MSTDEPFRTDYELLKGVDYIFVSLDRNLSGEECHELAEKYFETHKGMTLPGQALRVDLRPAFRKPLADVTPNSALFPSAILSRHSDEHRHVWRAGRSEQSNRLGQVFQPLT